MNMTRKKTERLVRVKNQEQTTKKTKIIKKLMKDKYKKLSRKNKRKARMKKCRGIDRDKKIEGITSRTIEKGIEEEVITEATIKVMTEVVREEVTKEEEAARDMIEVESNIKETKVKALLSSLKDNL